MKNLAAFLELVAGQRDPAKLTAAVKNNSALNEVYPDSIHESEGSILFLAKGEAGKRLWVIGKSAIFNELNGQEQSLNGQALKQCELSVANSKVIRKYFAFTNPGSLAKHNVTIGLGDRLGLASAGHIRLVKNYQFRPVLAQQSTRELNLTGRNYGGVLADVVWAVFQEDYQAGYGADGDHLKSLEEVKMALDYGFTMITLDCSEYINNLAQTDLAGIEQHYQTLDAKQRQELEAKFAGKQFPVGPGMTLEFTPELLKFNAAVYQKAIDFAASVFMTLIKPVAEKVDFEVSIDETQSSTLPSSHFFVAEQLVKAGVKINSMAPRFYGEFQKGIDYIGDLGQFEQDFLQHEKIAEHFGYKLSIHSGSDKFAVFPIIGRETKGRVHVKTAGTNWLEAVKVIIAADPVLYREMHQFALESLAEAKKYYHIKGDPAKIADLKSLSDEQLKDLMRQDDARQVIHITYGLILQAKDAQGNSRFRDRIYQCLNENEELFYKFLQEHIGKHLQLLGVK